ncbi:MAG: class A beta-lactamase [Polyangiales bacterium]
MTPTRRHLLLGALGALPVACARRPDAAIARAERALAALEARVGGRLGVFALDTGTGRHVARRADERFAMCSTFKWALAAAVLAEVDRGVLSLDARVPFSAADLLEYAPATRARVAEGAMTVGELARVAVTVSDNTAANLLLARIGGPAGVTRFARAQGDVVTRLDRTEPALNEGAPGDPRDTTSPRAMAGLVRRVVCGDRALSLASRERLRVWMRACETGHQRLRAAMPRGWDVGDKTGTGGPGAVNDVAFALPPGRAPIVVAAYTHDGNAGVAALSAALADVGRIVVDALA